MTYWVYMLASRKHGTLYVGVTNSLERRIDQHRRDLLRGFTKTYGVHKLVWFQGFGDVTYAIDFEKRLKRWRREWKIQLIEAGNPQWEDIYPAMMAPDPAPRSLWVPDSRDAASGMTGE